MCVCFSVCTCACVYTCAEDSGQPQVSLLGSHLPSFLKQGLSPAWSWLVLRPQGSACLHFPGAGITSTEPPRQLFFHTEFWRFELRSSRLCGKHFTNQGISLDILFFIVAVVFFLFETGLAWNSLWRSCWPRSHRDSFTCLSLPSAGIKGMCYHLWL